MIFTNEEAVKRALNPKNTINLNNAALQEERLIFHSEPILEKSNLPFTAYRNFTNWWQSLVSPSKYERINQLIKTPLATVSDSKEIFDQLQKFLDAQDRYIEFKFVSQDYTLDYNLFLKSQNDNSFWRQSVLAALKNKICSYVVVDLPAIQKTERPEPYNYFVRPNSVIDTEINESTGKVEYFIFKYKKCSWQDVSLGAPANIVGKFNVDDKLEQLVFIDDKYYRILLRKEGDLTNGEVLLANEHNLGYCPVIDFWRDSISGTNGINKIGPLTLLLSDFDYNLFYKACIDYMNLYGPFPILTLYNQDDKEEDEKDVVRNDGQYWDYSNYNAVTNQMAVSNPKKSVKDFMAPGGGFEVPAPASESDHDFMQNPLKFIGMDPESVKLANEILCNLRDELKRKATGVDDDYLNEIAKNEEMISASFRKEETILTWIKGNIERVHEFVTKTKCYLRYGEEYFKGAVIDYGSDYMLKDAKTLSKEFLQSKDDGMPQGYTSEISANAMVTRFKNNPEKLAKMRILLDIEPYPNLSFKEIKELGINAGDKINFIIKANFVSFVQRFENENGSIVEFGSAIEYSKKIEIIKKTITNYARDIDWAEPGNSASDAGGSGVRKPKK